MENLKVYAYCRVSTESQSMDRQYEAINTYVKDNNLEITEWFEDKISGKTFNRENYLRMKELADDNTIIIVKELDRLGREYDLIKDEYEYFINKGVRLIFIDTPMISSNLTKNQGLDQRLISDIVFQLLSWLSAKEREKISQRTKEALDVKKKQGFVLGRPKTDNSKVKEYLRKYYKTDKIETVCENATEELGISEYKFYATLREMKKDNEFFKE